LISWELSFFLIFPLGPIFSSLYASLIATFRSRAALPLEILALRHQLGVLRRSVKRPKFNPADRFLWAGLCTVWNGTVLSHALAISQIVCSPVRHKRFRTYTQERSQSKYARGEGLARQPLRQSTGSGLQLTLLLRCSTWTALMPVTRHHS
jgi:hypothetical protein